MVDFEINCCILRQLVLFSNLELDARWFESTFQNRSIAGSVVDDVAQSNSFLQGPSVRARQKKS